MGNVQSAYLSYSHYQDQQRKKNAQKIANSWQGKRMMKSGRMKRYVAKREKELSQGAALRKAEEEDPTQGERVWFSRCILNGRLQHWVLITHGMKYELRRRDHLEKNGNAQSPQLQDAQGEVQGDFVCNIKEYTIDQEKRDLSLTKLLIPETDGFYVCLIGWTQMTKEQVDAACHDVLTQFGKYSLLRNNCQDFLRQVADRILINSKAADYPWFISNTKTKYQKDQWLKPPPEEMMMRMLSSMQAAMQAQVQQQVQIQQQIQLQTQLQIQTQIQMQIQTQIQSQIQTQMQTQMQSQMMTAGGAGA